MALLLFLLLLSHWYYQRGNNHRKHHREDAGIEPCRQYRGLKETRWAGHREGGRMSRHKVVKQHSSLLKNKTFARCVLGNRRLSEQVFDFTPMVSTLSCGEWRVT